MLIGKKCLYKDRVSSGERTSEGIIVVNPAMDSESSYWYVSILTKAGRLVSRDTDYVEVLDDWS